MSLFLVRFLLFLTRGIPLKVSYSICTFLVLIATLIRWKRKDIVFNNLKIVFPGKTEKERSYLFRESLRKTLKSYFEFAYLISGKYTGERIMGMASATGLEYLDNLKSSDRGALLYSGHFGNFPLMLIWLALKGYPVAAVYKEAKNLPDDFFGNKLSKFNITPLKYKTDASLTVAIIRALKEGKLVFIQNDQSHPDGIYVDFFGKSVPAPAGPALLVKRVGVPVIPCYVYRDSNNHHHINILPEIELRQHADLEEFLRVNTQLLTDWVAELILIHPGEWYWLHNRWKRARSLNGFQKA